jgi:iron complex transport system substrate-binding protein
VGRSGALLLSLAALAALALGACTTSGDGGAARHAAEDRAGARDTAIVDDAGDTVRIAIPARRVASLIPATTELLFDLGAGHDVVGRTTWCDYPAAALAVPSLGDGINPSLEAIVASRPDLVLLYNSAQNETVARRLRALGVPAMRLATDRLADVPRLANLLGALTGRGVTADSLDAAYRRALAAATVPPAPRRPAVFLLVWDQPPTTVGRGSYLTELIERAGGRNVFDDIAASSGAVSIEAVAARDPDAILSLSDAPPRFVGRPEWRVVRAAREHRLILVSGSEFNRPTPRAPDAIRRLRARLAAVTGDSAAGAGAR